MSIEVMTLVFKRSLGSVTRKAVLLAMADAANEDGSGIWKSAETIASECDLSKRTVLRTWSELEAEGLIRRVGIRTVRGGEVIIWSIDVRAVSMLAKPGDRKSPSDTVTPSDRKSPGDNDDTDPVTLCPKPGDTVSPKPSLTHPINHHVEALEEIWSAWSPEGRKRSKAKGKIAEQLRALAKRHDLQAIKAAAIAFAADQKPEFHPALDRWLKDGRFENWQAGQSAPPAEMTTEDWQRAMRHWVDTGEWLADHVSPPPSDPACTAPANMIRHALKLRPERNAA